MRARQILLVDDDPRLRFSLKHILNSEGYKVVEAENGVQALKILSENISTGLKIDLLITDVQMPEMDGFELINALGGSSSGLKIIIVSGYEIPDKNHRLLGTGYKVIGKPFNAEELLGAVSSVLNY